MKKFIFAIFSVAILASFAFNANAQMMGRFSSDSSIGWEDLVKETVSEESAGKDIWNKFQEKEIACADITDTQFENMGEYFMGQMMGDSHAAMNAMMIQMHGKDGENNIHTVLGKRISGCDTSVTFPMGTTASWIPMMQMMLGSWSSPFGLGPMMWETDQTGWGFEAFWWIFMILWLALIIAGITALTKWFISRSRGTREHRDKSASEILRERYARGEIDKKEFEEKKKDLIYP